MALQINKTTEYGITLPSAYVRVIVYKGDMNNMIITTTTHADASARSADDREIEVNQFTVPAPDSIPAGGMIQWCYNQIKVLPEFAGYIDV